jgi:6-hydroxy-3-succinoylpyridine 3-monooxygenase
LGNRSIIYIDGFNFYYGVMKDSNDKWLNLEHYFRLLRQDDDIQKIYYFTAKVSGDAQVRQETYFQALQTLKSIKIVFGLYKSRQRKCKVSSCSNPKKNYADYEEKRTDVNIALQMLDDAYQNNCDRMIVVSGDSDLVPAVESSNSNICLHSF